MEHNGEAMEIHGEVIEVMADMEDNTEFLLLFNNQELLMLILMLDMEAGEIQVCLMLDMVDTEDMVAMVAMVVMDIQSITRV